MDPLEELMNGMDMDPRRRGSGAANPGITLSRLLPMLLGLRFPNMAGNATDSRNRIGGPNVAPGALQGEAVNQPGGGASPMPMAGGVEAGWLGETPGQGAPPPGAGIGRGPGVGSPTPGPGTGVRAAPKERGLSSLLGRK